MARGVKCMNQYTQSSKLRLGNIGQSKLISMIMMARITAKARAFLKH